jgi:hypothetical protein
MVRSKSSNQRPDTLMQDRICQIDENLLHRTAGPYIRVRLRRHHRAEKSGGKVATAPMVPSKNGMLDAVCSSSTSDAATSSRRPSDAAFCRRHGSD